MKDRMLIRALKYDIPGNRADHLPYILDLHTNPDIAHALRIDISKLEDNV